MTLTLTDEQISRFWGKVNKAGPLILRNEGACWIWTGARNSGGYGQIHLKGSPTALAHRISFMLSGGVLRGEKNLCCHRCDNPACVNPDHIFAGSHHDNMADMVSKGRGFFVCYGIKRSKRKPYKRRKTRKKESETPLYPFQALPPIQDKYFDRRLRALKSLAAIMERLNG